jgi:bacterioferritin
MPTQNESTSLTREKLVELLNEDLSREYQAIIAYVNYSQVLKGAQYMNIAGELAIHATEELAHAIALANHIDYLGGMPTVTPSPSRPPTRTKRCSASTSKTNG